MQYQLENGQHFLLISNENEAIGYASFELNFQNSNKTKIHKIYILPTIQGMGMGKIVMNYIKKIAEENFNLGLILNVNRYNKALFFYEKYGFKNLKTVDIEIGNGYLMQDYCLELEF